ncbi:Esterase PIR7B [Zea mays]|uniref:Esterase PIR7B n=2 Tax=Zea mays TaxID=4577 RepID=A0A1D6N249_MAIZE|nr:Esterase PIR7B [Zea mays]
MDSGGGGKHFILLHGLAHGAWCWYKVVAQLRAAGHRATALDMAASGVHPARLHEVASFEDYSRPLLDAVAASPDSDRLVLFKRTIKPDFFMDSTTTIVNTEQGPRTALLFGPNLLASKLYDQCPAEDLELAKLLVRPGFQFMDDPTMKDETLLTDGNYGSVKRVFVVAKADRSSTEEMQRRMVELSPGADVEEVAGADHMAMLSKPTEQKVTMWMINKHGGKAPVQTKGPSIDRELCGSPRQREAMEVGGGEKHFVLVHGLCLGAWSWYKVATALESAGHRVTALDLAASGAHPARLQEVRSFEEYSRPLLDAVAAAPDGDRLVLVGHSHGGASLALAMERFPRKVAAAVFVDAAMPWVGKHIGVTTEGFMKKAASKGLLMDCQIVAITDGTGSEEGAGQRGTAIVMGPEFLKKCYKESPAEDLTLATLLVRPGNQFMDDPVMKDEALLTAANYGSVKKVFVVAKAAHGSSASAEEVQSWLAATNPGTEMQEIAGADHAVMNSKPRELCDVLVGIASRYD